MKRIWKGLGIAAVALIFAGAALVLFAPVGGFKAPLEAEVAAATGRAFHIEGPLSLAFTPELALDLGVVTLGAGAAGDAAPLVRARRATLAIRFLPLLSGEARATALTLEGAEIVFTPGGAGWRFQPAAGSPPATPFDALAFGDVRLVDSRIHIGDLVIEARDLRLRWPRQGQSLSVSGDIVFRERSFAVEAVIERRDALVAGGRVPLHVAFNSTLAQGSLDGVADFGTFAFEGGVSLSAPSTRGLAGFFGAAIPGDRAFGELSLSAAVKAGPGEIHLRDARFALGEATGAGTFAVRLADDRPAISGSLSVDRFTLGDYLGLAAQDSPDGWRDLAFDLSGLAGFDADLAIKARNAEIAGFHLQNLAMTLTNRGGRLWARIDNAIAFAAILNGAITAHLDGGAPKIALTLSAEGFDAQSALAAAFQGEGLTGRGNIKLDLTATGATRGELIASVSGRADIVLIDGALDGIDPAEIARTAADENGPSGLGGDAAVAFKRLSAAFVVQNGRARTTSLRLVSNNIRMDAAGAFDLPARTLALRAVPVFTADADGRRNPADEGRLAMPFAVSGAWGAPVAEADWPALMAALRAGRVAPEDLDRLPEPRRAWFKDLADSGAPLPWPAGIPRDEKARSWFPW